MPSATPAHEPRKLRLFDLISINDAIVLATAPGGLGEKQDRHAIVWDGWRSILFIGPGKP